MARESDTKELPKLLRNPAWVERARERHRAKLETDHPRLFAAVVAVEGWFLRFADRVVPPGRVDRITVVLASMIILDSSATALWLREGLAVEGNPWVDAMIATYGQGVGLAVRAFWSLTALWFLRAGALRAHGFRVAMTFVVVGLSAITLLHVSAMAWFTWQGDLFR